MGLLLRPTVIPTPLRWNNSPASSANSFSPQYHTDFSKPIYTKPPSSPFIPVRLHTGPATAAIPPTSETTHKTSIREFLLQECGFSPQQLSLIQKRNPSLLGVKSTERARQAAQILRHYGFSEPQLRKLILQNPAVLSYRAEETLRPRLDLIKALGFSDSDLGDVLSRGPRVLCIKELQRSIIYLETVFEEPATLRHAVRKLPHLLGVDPDKAQSLMDFLRQSDLPKEVILPFISRNPRILLLPPEDLAAKLDYLRNLGVCETPKRFLTALGYISRTGKNLDKRVKALSSCGLDDNKIKEVFRKFPYALGKSPEKLQRVMNYLVGEAGLSPDVIVKYPEILGLSLEKRIMPRHEAFKFLVDSGRFPRFRSLARVIKLSESTFVKRFVKGNPDKYRILQIINAHLRD